MVIKEAMLTISRLGVLEMSDGLAQAVTGTGAGGGSYAERNKFDQKLFTSSKRAKKEIEREIAHDIDILRQLLAPPRMPPGPWRIVERGGESMGQDQVQTQGNYSLCNPFRHERTRLAKDLGRGDARVASRTRYWPVARGYAP